MDFSPEQHKALTAVNHWMHQSNDQVFRMFGYAGTGKTTLARHFAQGVSGNIYFAAFTGKAASVMRAKGCVGATTLHSLLYRACDRDPSKLKELEAKRSELLATIPEDQQDQDHPLVPQLLQLTKSIEEERKLLGNPSFSLNRGARVSDASLVIIDECSMVDERLGKDLLSFNTKVLVLGDPGQLPPVYGPGYFTNGARPNVILTGIHRQAESDPIIHMAHELRWGRYPKPGRYGVSEVLKASSIPKDELGQRVKMASQVLVGRNVTRRSFNHRIRALLGHKTLLPSHSEKLVCLRNNHDLGLMNGAIWRVEDSRSMSEERCALAITPEDGGEEVCVEAHTYNFLGLEQPAEWWVRKEAEELDYGYALTVHKSQGSQWPHVLIYDESGDFGVSRYQWLYTAVTRAVEKVTLVIPG